jgi:tetratricopeptide (TPR) repeat protein
LKRYAWLIPVLAGALAYAIAPWAELVWDDQMVVRQQLSSIRSFDDVLQPPAGISKWSYAYYRPMVVLSYLLDARLFGAGASAGPHTANVLYHLIATFMVWALANRLLRHRPNGNFGALAAATLFALHPIHTESVSWVTGRSDLLATMFLVPAMFTALYWRDQPSVTALLASAVLFLLALLSKEVAIAGLLILPLLWLARAPQLVRATGSHHARAAARRVRADWFPALAVATGWLAAGWCYWSLRAAGNTPAVEVPDTLTKLLLPPVRAAAWYVQKLILPWPQSSFVPWEMIPTFAFAAAVLLSALVLLAWSLIHWRRSGDGALFAGLWWIGIAIAPSLSTTLPGLAETPVAERYLYLPSVGLALALGAILSGPVAAKRIRLATAAVSVLAVAYLALTWQRGYVWLDDLRLWTDVTSKVTGYGLPWVELGRAHDARDDKDAALAAFLKARSLKNSPETSAVANFNVGLLYAQRGDLRNAGEYFAAAVAADPAYPRGHYGLGRVIYERTLRAGARPAAERLARLQEAASHLELACTLNPAFVEAHVALAWVIKTRGDVFQETADFVQARVSYRAALASIDRAAGFDPDVRLQRDAQAVEHAATLQLQRLGF